MPSVTSGGTANFAENAIGTAYQATGSDPDAGTTLSWALGGVDAALFNISSTTGAVTFKAAPNFEAPTDAGANNVYDITVAASDGTLSSAARAVAITVTNVNEVPSVTSAGTANFAENASGVVYQATGSDPDASTTLSWVLGGVDAALFNLNGATGEVTFKAAPNFEAPADAGANNVYDITVAASDGTLSSAARAVAITVTNVNEVPSVTSAGTANFAENASGVVYQATGSDPDASTTLSWVLGGVDAALFNLNGATGEVTFKAAPNFEAPADAGANNVYDITVAASDGTLSSAARAVAITVTNVNEVPSVTSAGTANFAENASGVVYQATGSDPDASTTLSWVLGGVDAALFNLNGATGEVTFKAAPNFEAPADAGANNVYDITVAASDGTLSSAARAVAITVTNVNEVPSVTSAGTANFAENASGVVYQATGSDPDASTTLSWVLGGVDAALFNLNGATGEVTFKAAPNFEAPADAGANNVYDVTVAASDGTLSSAARAVAITVTNVNEVPSVTSAGTANFAENASGVVYQATGSDPDASTTLSWVLGGVDAALFNLNGATGEVTFKAAPNFEAPADAGANNVYDITVAASDGTLSSAARAVAITVTNVNEVPSVTSAGTANFAENASGVVYQATGSDPDASTTLSWVLGGVDAALFNLNGATGEVTFKAAPNFEAPADAGANNVYDVTVAASDGTLSSAARAVAITVTNVNEVPSVTSAGTANFAENGTGVAYQATGSDPDAGTTLSWALGGVDAALFNISSTTGAVTFKAAPNFEAPTDAGANNVYDITVTASDGTLSSAARAVAITVSRGVNLTGTDGADNLVGTTANETLSGLGGNDTLYGLAGNDLLSGGEGDDILNGGSGADTLNGGNGFDYVTYENAASGLAAFLTTPASNTGEANGDTYISIEGMVGTSFADTLIADEGANILIGLGGSDVLFGAGGNDTIYGGDGDDSFFGGTGADVLIGGGGFDYARYDFAAAGVAIFIYAPSFNTLEAVGDIFIEIEGLIGSAFSDTLFGDEGVNVIGGNDGNDVIFGAGGGDALYGGDGDDSFFGGDGGDYINGGNGYDYVRFDFAAAGVTASLATGSGTRGEAAGDIYADCEAILGSEFADVLFGDGGNNVLVGNGGDDVLIGNAGIDSMFAGFGNDVLNGGAGADALYGGDGADQFYIALGEGGDTINDFTSTVDRLLLIGFGFTPGASLDGRFVAGTAPTSSLSQFLFNPATNVLSFDSNGIGAGGVSVVCNLQTGATIRQQDLFLV
ncbi:hypothetical protein LHU95_00615 [Sediminicoccus sp. KRV36]|nr:hypothetical protein LHU95_00615 [Sediminicoccus rosea]